MNEDSSKPSAENEVDTSQPGEDRQSSSAQQDAVHAAKGFAMGICDAVPGVSGGTVALVVGIYDRLFNAISRIDRTFLAKLLKRQWAAAFARIDARFLIALMIGIVLGYGTMSILIKKLMASDSLRPLTLASFAGMIIGSLWVVAKMIKPDKTPALVTCVACGLIGFGLSLFIAMQSFQAGSEFSLLYLFLCAIVAICAMILPGISGAMILLILGVYYSVLDIPGELLRFQHVSTNLIRLTVFVSGCAIGLLTFGRVIKWSLKQFRAPTLATMFGLMCGSLILLWPFQTRHEPEVEHHKPTYEAFLPTEINGTVVASVVCVIIFAMLVILVDRASHSTPQHSNNES